MNTKNFIICIFLALSFTACTKESQELVVGNGYTIQEGGQAVKDYRNVYEGSYLMHCVKAGSAFQKLITIVAAPTQSGYVYLESLFQSGEYHRYTGPEIIAKINSAGELSFGHQVMEFRYDNYNGPAYHIYTEGIGTIDSEFNINLDFKVKDASANLLPCSCQGKKK